MNHGNDANNELSEAKEHETVAKNLSGTEVPPESTPNTLSRETLKKLSDLSRKSGDSPSVSPPYLKSTNEFLLPGKVFTNRRLLSSLSPDAQETPPKSDLKTQTSKNGMSSGTPVKDEDLFADVLFMWLGVRQTHYLAVDDSTRQYSLQPSLGSPAQGKVVEVFQACGALAYQIDSILKRSSVAASYLQQSLRSALRKQLMQYHCFIASLRQRLHPPLTTGELTAAMKRMLPKLWVMHHILQETETVKGGELASKLQYLIQQGSHRLASLLSDIYIEAISPLLQMTVSSITQGEVADPFNEFFITSNPGIEDASDSYWTSKYSLSMNMLPQSVLSRDVAEDILLITKNICFIKQCCRAKQWRMNSSIVLEAGRASFDSIPRTVQLALDHSNAAVMRLILEEFKVDEVFKIVNAFLLVGYGDFFEILIQKVEPILSKLSQTIQISLVREQVEGALLQVMPYARHLDTDRFSSLHCEVVKDEARIGWDAFVITMTLSAPLNNLFDSATIKVYRRLFRMMFKVKVAEVSLKNAWRQSVALDRVIGTMQGSGSEEIRAWREVAADAHLLGLQLNHFVMNLWSYLVSEVSTVAWDLLHKSLARCKSFDDIRTAHNSYLAYLTQRSLLHSDCASIRINIENVLTIVREYRGSQALLSSLLERGCGELVSIKRQYQNLTDEFHRSMSSLLTTLEEQHMQYDYLNFLLLRLNFNRFYHDTDAAGNTEF